MRDVDKTSWELLQLQRMKQDIKDKWLDTDSLIVSKNSRTVCLVIVVYKRNEQVMFFSITVCEGPGICVSRFRDLVT